MMARDIKKRKYEDEEDKVEEDEMEEEEEDGEEGEDGEEEDDIDEEEIDEELALPDVLSNISFNEKKKLLKFKRNHNEREWEEEVLRRSDLLARKIDMERLKRMTKGSIDKEKAKEAAPSRAKSASKRRVAKRRAHIESDESDEAEKAEKEDEEEADEGEEEDQASDEDDDDDDLFDSDEEEEISKKFSKKKEEADSKKARASSRLQSALLEDEDDEEGAADDWSDDERLDGDDIDLGKIKNKGKQQAKGSSKGSSKKGREGSSDIDKGDGYGHGEDSKVPSYYLNEGKPDDSPPANLDKYLRVQVRRQFIEQCINEPFLHKCLVGQYVRFMIGPDAENNPVYRMCEIVSVETTQKTYKNSNLHLPIHLRLSLSIGGAIKNNNRINEVL